MKFAATRSFADPEMAARKLLARSFLLDRR